MNKQLSSIILLILLTITTISFAQNDSTKRTVLNGKEFYMYEVKTGESLYKISKSFNIPQEEIIQYNQEAASGVNTGMTLKIPVISARKNAIKAAKTTPATATTSASINKENKETVKDKESEQFTTHKVEKGQTIYSICKQYQVDKATLLKLNPSLSSGLQVGEDIKVPAKKAKTKVKEDTAPSVVKTSAPAQTSFVEHVVVAKETLFSISRKYGVSVDDINKYNKEELKNGLQTGLHLKIPSKGTKTAPAKKPTATKSEESAPIAKAASTPKAVEPIKKVAPVAATTPEVAKIVVPVAVPKPVRSAEKSSDKVVRVALLLPFMISDSEKQDATINKFVEFYEGFLLGINKLKDEGVSVELSTYDIEKTDAKAKEVLQKNSNIKKADLIIGPAYTSQVKAVAEFAQANNIPVVVPFSPKIENIGSNAYIFQNNCPQQKQFAQASKLFVKNFTGKNIVIIHFNNDINDEGSEFSRHMATSLKKQKIAFHDVLFTQENFVNIQKAFTPGKETILILGTDKPMLIKELLPKISQLNSENTPISIVGFPSWEKVLKTYSSTYYFSQFYVSKNNKDNAFYKEKFRQEFGFSSTTAPRFDLMGFDLSTYFIKALSSQEKDFSKIPAYKQEHSLQSKFHFQKISATGGYINDGMLLIHYAQNKEAEVIE
ncbi:MAG: LysM peptidoglycan-binding domain-containing protein [Paludibacteraceae bacterium]|nr:LysM peptidoglycan-binding domain-containing protein [Paludibacteraceae bacterium]